MAFFHHAVFACVVAIVAAQQFRSGVGIADVTGPASEIPFMGYAFPNQTGMGIHYRLYARSFIFEDAKGNRLVYVNGDICMGFYGIKMAVIEELQKVFGTLYDHHNVIISGTHTHSGPGALSWFLLYDISMLGHDKKHAAAVVQGIVQSIVNAHNNVGTAGPVKLTQGLLQNASANRSPSSYLANPQAERDEYAQWGGDTDKNMTVLRIENSTMPIGMLSFFAVHGTSMHNSNRLVSGDNKGHAARLFEQWVNGNHTLVGHGPFVAAFGQSNEGDVTPNTQGAWCYGVVGGIDCSMNRSLCNGKNEHCVSVGPTTFADDFGSCKLIGERQFFKARELFEEGEKGGVALEGEIKTVFKWVNMSNVTVSAKFATTGVESKTCRPAAGDSFAAGTTDGPGAFNFYQGMFFIYSSFSDCLSLSLFLYLCLSLSLCLSPPSLMSLSVIIPLAPFLRRLIHQATTAPHACRSGTSSRTSCSGPRPSRSRASCPSPSCWTWARLPRTPGCRPCCPCPCPSWAAWSSWPCRLSLRPWLAAVCGARCRMCLRRTVRTSLWSSAGLRMRTRSTCRRTRSTSGNGWFFEFD